jgi:hypothetical protein
MTIATCSLQKLFRSQFGALVLTRSLVVVMAVALLGGLASVDGAAAQGTTVENSVQINAFANASWCEPGPGGETCYEARLEVAAPGKFGGVVACFSVFGTGPGGETFEEGCVDVANTFVLDPNDLSTASLLPTEFDLLIDLEFFSRTVTLEATWTGVSKTEKFTDRIGDAQNNCVTHTKIKAYIQTATTTLVLDGVDHEGTGELQVLEVQDRIFCRQL